MSSITITTTSNSSKENSGLKKSFFSKIESRYSDYVMRQEDSRIYWYMKVIISIPCVFMVPSIWVMASMVYYFEYFVGFSMALFFANVLIHIIGTKSKLYVPFYHLTVFLFISIPVITYFIICLNNNSN